MARTPRVVLVPLIPERLGDLERLFGPRGACAGCWCMYPRLRHAEFQRGQGAPNRRAFRRLVHAGPVVQIPRPIITSARRWRRDGWFRRSARNMALLGLYVCGVSPRVLARWY